VWIGSRLGSSAPERCSSILDNPRCTGCAFFDRWTRRETLLDPDGAAPGHVVWFRRADPDWVVRWREQAHPAIVSVEEFTQAQLLRRSKAVGGLKTARKTERSGRRTTRTYPFRAMFGARCVVGRWRPARERTRCTTGARHGPWHLDRWPWHHTHLRSTCERTRSGVAVTPGSVTCSTE
jgi:hypothetical protein